MNNLHVLFLGVWQRLQNYLASTDAVGQECFFNTGRVLPEAALVEGFGSDGRWSGTPKRCALPRKMKNDPEAFPILQALSSRELESFSSIKDDQDYSPYLLGPIAWEMRLSLSKGKWVDWLRSRKQTYVGYTILDYIARQSDEGRRAAIKLQLRLRSAAERLFHLAKAYDIYLGDRQSFLRLVNEGTFIDSFGKRRRRDFLTEKVLDTVYKLGMGGLEVPHLVLVEDIIAFASMPSATIEKKYDWKDYEEECAKRLEGLGFNVQLTRKGPDYGADIIAEKDDLVYLIQCKLHLKPIGIKAVQEVHAAAGYYTADYCAVLGESGFTPAARELAGRLQVVLLSEQLASSLEQLCVSSS